MEIDRYWRDRFHEALSKDPHARVLPFAFAGWLQKKQTEEINRKREIFWITLNPKPVVTFDEFKCTVMSRLMSRIFMKGATFVFEQRAAQAPYSGFHCHIIVDKRMTPKQMHDRVFNTMKGCCQLPKHVDLRTYPYSYRTDKLDYMNGKKWDSEKDPIVEATKAWRDLEGIDDIYTNDDLKE